MLCAVAPGVLATLVHRFLIILMCAFMATSHGGIVAAHSHYDGMSAHHLNTAAHHETADSAAHDDDHDNGPHENAAVAVDNDGDRPAPSTIAHHHIVVDASARPPVLASVRVVNLRFEPPLRRDALPPSATVAPGLEPPDA